MGFSGSIPCIFSFLGGAITPYIYANFGQSENGGLWKAFGFGSAMCILSLILSFGLVKMDNIAVINDA